MNLWEVHLKMVDLTEEMDRLMADYLELKHRLENINLD